MNNVTLLNTLLKRWLFWDGDLHAELSVSEIILLRNRLVNKKQFDVIGKQMGISEVRTRMLFDNIILKLYRAYGNTIADLIIELDDQVESFLRKSRSAYGFDYSEIPIN